ncbi:MAG: class I SAM-dependent methyltransferase [Treponema sp.]|jgi:SAM-dependent methyltransferase|nr:class I SAM-dependent methyltransferase [Treponema sp.]
MPRNGEWFNDDPFWETFAPIMFDNAHWAETASVADGITRLARLDLYRVNSGPGPGPGEAAEPPATAPAAKVPAAPATPPRCLDLCCGFGRVGLELARRGFSLTGVDITAAYLDCAREDAAAENLDAEFIREDVRDFKRPGAFDIAINIYNSFGYFENPSDDLLLCRNARESLKKGGTFFIETIGKEIAARDFIDGEWFRRAGYFVFTEYEVLDSWGAIKNTWRLIPEAAAGCAPSSGSPAAPVSAVPVIEKTFVHRLYAASELRSLLLEAGFASVDVYGDWDERPYDEGAVKLILAGRT